MNGYSGARACEIVGISYRQLDYWARTDLLRPSVADARGSGSRRRYSLRDLITLAIIRRLLEAGVRLEAIRGILTHLPLPQDLTDIILVIDRPSSQFTTAEALPDLCRSTTGTLTVLPLTTVQADLMAQNDLMAALQ